MEIRQPPSQNLGVATLQTPRIDAYGYSYNLGRPVAMGGVWGEEK